MPLLDHFHSPLKDYRHWEGFHHAWATVIAQQLNQDVLPADYVAEPAISLGPEFAVDVATLKQARDHGGGVAMATWKAPRAKFAVPVSFARLEKCEVKVYQDLGTLTLRAAIELVSPANKDRPSSRKAFAAKCASYVKNGIGVIVVDTVTSRLTNLYAEIAKLLDLKGNAASWRSATGLFAAAYRPVTVRQNARVEIWPEPLAIAKPLPVLPLWLAIDLHVPLHLEESYLTACKSLRISA